MSTKEFYWVVLEKYGNRYEEHQFYLDEWFEMTRYVLDKVRNGWRVTMLKLMNG